MVRALTFEQIVDSRNNLEKVDLLKRDEKLMKLFNQQDALTVVSQEPQKLVSDDGTVQYRIRYYVKKEGRKLTWNDVFHLVNSVKAVPYNFTYYNFKK